MLYNSTSRDQIPASNSLYSGFLRNIYKVKTKYERYLNKIIWDDGKINYKIDGRASEDEIIKIAKSMGSIRVYKKVHPNTLT